MSKPVKLLPFTIGESNDYVVEHPVYHPLTDEYRRYWLEQASYCIYGRWCETLEDGVIGYRWMPPNLYFYVNMWQIIDESEFGEEVYIRPRLRDLEFYVFYASVICEGFSGFEDDEEYTCHELIGKIQRGEELKNYEKILLEKYEDRLRKSNGEFKQYVEPMEYLCQLRSEKLGKPMWLNEKRDMILFGTRGGGKSYMFSCIKVGYPFVFNGAKTLEDYLEKKTKSTIVIAAAESKYSTDLLKKFEDGYEYLRKHVGAYDDGKEFYNGVFWAAYEGSLSLDAKRPFTNRVTIEGGRGFKGAGSTIYHVTFKNNIHATVGKRASHILIEEAALIKNLDDILGEQEAVLRRKRRIGWTAYIGTGGHTEGIRAYKSIYYNPDKFGFFGVQNKFDNKSKKIGLFIPAYYRNDLYRDEYGNVDVKKAYDDEIAKRNELKKVDSGKYHRYKLSYPIIPEEMFRTAKVKIFPADRIERRLSELEEGGKYDASFGMLHYTDSTRSKVVWEEDLEGVYPRIVAYGDEDNLHDLDTCYNVYEHPVDYRFDYPDDSPLYMVFYDTVHRDISGTSLAVAFVFKFWDYYNPNAVQFNVVAEWIGRCRLVEDIHDRVLKLAIYYNARVLFEDNGDFQRYCRLRGLMRYLQPEPALNGISNRYGVYIKKAMRPDLELFANEVLLTDVDVDERIVNGEYVKFSYKMVDRIPSKRLLGELLYYNREGNFDYVSAFFLLALQVRVMKFRNISDDLQSKSKATFNDMFKYLSTVDLEYV